MRFEYVCEDCGLRFATDEVVYRCPACGGSAADGEFPRGNLTVECDSEDLARLAGKKDLSFLDFLPYEIPFRAAYPVGGTPLARPLSLARMSGFRNLSFKLDCALPSGSFKDRASQLVAAQALAHNERKVALASTGNAGAAMSCAGAAYGLEVILFVPESAPANKLMQSILYGATVVPVRGTYDDAFALSIVYTERFGGINRNTAYNPMTVEGKKSVSIELYLQMGRRVPDVVYVPVGDGCIIGGVHKGFKDLRKAGLIDRLPVLVACQSSRSDAISRAFATGEARAIPSADTLADSISVRCPANGRGAVRALRESGGRTAVVSDQEILQAQRELAAEAGVFVEPAAACAWAGFKKDSAALAESMGPDAEACVLLTGTGFKDMGVFAGKVRMPLAIENSPEAVIRRFSSR